MKNNSRLLSFAVYTILLLSISFYWAENFSMHVHYKGDESILWIEITGIVTYVALILMWFIVKRVNLIVIFLLPLLMSLLSVISCFVLFVTTTLSGKPKQGILVYSLVHIGLFGLIVNKLWKPKIKKI